MEKTVSEPVTGDLENNYNCSQTVKPVTTYLEIILVTGNQLPIIL